MKAILVIDMPQDCLYCPCYRPAYHEYLEDCKVALRPLTTEERDSRPNWCPLKPLPNKIDQGYPCEKYDEGYSDGWDACINEILGGQE